MKLPPQAFPRRLLLRGFGGLAVALPALELTHGKAWAASASAPPAAKRFLVFFEHGGTISNVDRDGNRYLAGHSHDGSNVVDAWTPKSASGSPLVLNDIHQPLLGFEGDLLFLGGIDNLANKTQGPYDGDHGWANASVLTNAKVTTNGTDEFAQGPSIDAVIAGRMAQAQPVAFSSVNLMVEAHNYGSPFYTGANQSLQGETDPRVAFDRIFANVTGSGPDPALVRARALKKSILDGVSSGLGLYRTKLSSQDRIAIDAHLTLIRGLEQQLQALPSATCSKPTLVAPFTDIPQIGPAHVDILVAAMACGLTNVGTLNIGDFYNKWMNPPYPAAYDIGHSLDHSANDVGPGGTDQANFSKWYTTILQDRQWRAQMFQRLISGLKNIPEAGGTLLDNSLILWTSEFTYGGQHTVANLPVALAGRAGGALKTGRYLDLARQIPDPANPSSTVYQTSASVGNLHTSLLNLCGYPDGMFGEVWPDYSVYNGNRPYIGTQSVRGPLPGLT